VSIDQERTRQYWDDRHFDPGYAREEWSFHPAAKARLHRLLGASSREEWFWTKYLSGKTGLRGVGIGVGLGQTELRLVSSGAFAQYDFYDVSPAALEQVKRDAEKIGVSDKIKCICADIDALELGTESYDLVTFIASLHHMNDLPDILGKCKAALRPGGRLWAVEYIGPDRFQFPDKDTEFARRFYRSVHPGLKKFWTPELQFPSAEEVIKADPTESIHSSKIPAVMHATFKNVETVNTYGTFAFILFWGLLHDALYESPIGQEFVATVLDIDTMLIDSGQLPHYFAYYVATK
jgi:ubiquinone/menaquinone biosynthesis C-methylase UbiE